MNKKVNTILFILGATLFNILVVVLSFILLLVIYINFIVQLLPESTRPWGFSFIFIAAIAISILVYRFVLRFLLTKIDVEKYFDPLFVRRNIRKSPSE